jgi:trigger factor
MTVETSEIQITKVGEEPGVANLKVEVALPRVEAAEQKATALYQRRAKLPGFRKGKAPLAVVRKMYRDAIRESVIRELVEDTWKTAVEQEQLKPIADPRVRDLKFEEGSPVTFQLQVEIKPEIALGRVGGFRLKRRLPPVTHEMVENQIEELRRQKAPWVPVTGGRPANGELVSVSIATLTDGEPEETKQYQLLLGSGQAIPDLEDGRDEARADPCGPHHPPRTQAPGAARAQRRPRPGVRRLRLGSPA